MIVIKNNRIIKHKTVYFAKKPVIWKGFFITYIQSTYKKKVLGYKRNSFYSLIIRLKDYKYESTLSKKALYEIKRAQKELIVCETSNNYLQLEKMYNEFWKSKNVKTCLDIAKIKKYGNLFEIRVALSEKKTPIIFHTYFKDPDLKIVRLVHSVSLRNIEPEYDSAYLGRANRLLHVEDMKYYKTQGYETYDFGGYAVNTNENSLKGINKFKESFGGELIEYSNYENVINDLIIKMVNKIKWLQNI